MKKLILSILFLFCLNKTQAQVQEFVKIAEDIKKLDGKKILYSLDREMMPDAEAAEKALSKLEDIKKKYQKNPTYITAYEAFVKDIKNGVKYHNDYSISYKSREGLLIERINGPLATVSFLDNSNLYEINKNNNTLLTKDLAQSSIFEETVKFPFLIFKTGINPIDLRSIQELKSNYIEVPTKASSITQRFFVDKLGKVNRSELVSSSIKLSDIEMEYKSLQDFYPSKVSVCQYDGKGRIMAKELYSFVRIENLAEKISIVPSINNRTILKSDGSINIPTDELQEFIEKSK